MDPRYSGGVDENDFRVLDPDDLDVRQIRYRRAIPCLDADATDIDRAGSGNQVGVPFWVEGKHDALACLHGGPHHPCVSPDRRRIVLGEGRITDAGLPDAP